MFGRCRRWAIAGVAALCVACSGGGSTAVTVPVAPRTTRVLATTAADLPLVGEISTAIAALEAQLGAPQEYFEINATSQLINIWVSLNGGTIAQPWVWLDGVLTSREGQPAQGARFVAAALTFDPARLLATVAAQLPMSALDAVEIVGGADGAVQYTVVATSQEGGQLLVVVGPDGAVVSVESA